MASLPSSSSSPNWNHDVFPSFHGADVRKTFLPHIMREFKNKGIETFLDHVIKQSNSISPELIEAMRGSRIAIVMLSRNYLSSSWCLDELVEIMKCREELGQTVVPVFYELDPTDVRNQTGYFEELIKKTCEGKAEEEITRWKQALEKVGTMAGYDTRNWDDEAAMIENIVTGISNILDNSTPTSVLDDGMVGLEAHMENMESLLCPDSDAVRILGIWGPSGIGKTTIATRLYQRISHEFQFSTIITNVKGFYASTGHNEHKLKLQLHNQFLSQLINQKETDEIFQLGVARDRLKGKKVLIVLDDVDQLVQLEALAKEIRWFGPGSRIIISTQDAKLLKAHGINHIYKVDFPSTNEALQIFCKCAFGQKFPKNGFEELAWEMTTLSGKDPLGLSLMGSYFRGMSKEDWENELPMLKASLNGELESTIKFIYGFLFGKEKELSHHDISHLHNGELSKRMEEYAKGIWKVRQKHIITHAVYICCEDTLQYSFASHLSLDFRRKGIAASVNCNGTLDVIEGASAIVVVFSKSGFSSTSCLNNLVRVLQCRRKTGQLVVPVFYGISPSDVVVQEHESADLIREWSSVLQELRELPGHQSREECNECELVEEIVKDVYEKLFPMEQIGINPRLLEIEELFCKQPWGIRRIGIWGMPGIGKTTLAKAFFDHISGGYEASCFIKHFDKAFHEKGLHRLLEEHFGRILKELPRVCSSITRPSLLRDTVNKKRTLVVLDDVHNPLVAESFLGGLLWFGSGSLIIITSRDKQVFRFCQINHVYEVKSLNEDEALHLFSQCAFGKDLRKENLLERRLSMEVIDYASGNPLVLRFYGGELKGKELSDMETTFRELKKRTPYKIHDLFKSSYETLNNREKNIFLDIACFFNGENVDYVMPLLEGCGFSPHVGVDVLKEKCLVTVSENRVKMHRIIQNFGREIINGETVQIERRRRLWEPCTIKFLLEDDELEANGDPLGTEDIEGICLDTSNLLFDVNPSAFENMLNLRFLKIYCSSYIKHYRLRLPKGLESLPYELRLLHWENYPLKSLPYLFDPCHLVELNMPYSQLRKLWAGTKNLDMLKRIRLGHSQQLTEIDNICEAQNIELIDLQGCTKLESFPAIGHLQHLRVVNLSHCRKIKSFPEVSPNIEELDLRGTGISKLPISIGNATNLKKLCLSGCSSLVGLPSSIGNATNLQELNLNFCSSLIELPSSLGNATNLKKVYLTGCSSLVEIPYSIQHLMSMDLDEDNKIPTWKTDLRLFHSQNQNEAKTQRQEETAFHDARKQMKERRIKIPMDRSRESDEEDEPSVEDRSPDQEAEEVNESVRLEEEEEEERVRLEEEEEEERVRQEQEELEAKMKEITRKREAIMERKKKRQKIVSDKESKIVE